MNDSETIQRDVQLTSYLQYLQALRSEMAVAMDCIAHNALAPLQESIAKQEVLSAELVLLAKKLRVQEPSPDPAWMEFADPAIVRSVREATKALRQTNSEYSALVKHAGRTLSLLSSLWSTHAGHLQEARGSRSKYQTWSCEM